MVLVRRMEGGRAGLNAVYRNGRDVASPVVLDELAHELGVKDARAAILDPAVKARLRANTEWASAQGVFGVPTLLIDGEIFWGHDAFDMALEYLENTAGFRIRPCGRLTRCDQRRAHRRTPRDVRGPHPMPRTTARWLFGAALAWCVLAGAANPPVRAITASSI
jgi:hypothetical protein